MNIPQVNMGNFNYELPEERIRKAPLAVRSDSRLVLQNEQGTYFHVPFSRFSDYLSANDLLIGNASKVVPARLFFKKVSGATIEVLCLSPYNLPYAEAFSKFKTVQFLAYVGNSKKWKDGPIVCTTDFDSNSKLILEAKRIGQVKDSFIIEFTWNVDIPFSEVLECCGRVPIPPYFARLDEALDKERYQTVYAKWEGSVAAPTAGLHYDHVVMKKLVEKNIFFKYLTLHVGAGTFKPVVSDEISGHEMHSESFEISEDLLHDILNSKGRIIAAGTTSLRALESIYW
ncbi:MAG: S-adenosylmethionine:tRNA ribosyltransferase-isomerase, partial [Bacteroidota bacterium]